MNVSDKERQFAFNLCNNYLPGAWRDIDVDQIIIEPVSGGMTNLLYRCSLEKNIITSSDEPRQVLLRIYGPLKCDVEVELEIFNQLALVGLGPRLISTFDTGRFEEYLPSNALRWKEMTDDSIARVMAHKIAAIQELEVASLDKRSNWLLDKWKQMETNIRQSKHLPLEFSDYVPESSRIKARNLIEIDFNSEIAFLEEALQQTQIDTLVFSHNDLHQNNVILLHDKSLSLEDRVVLIDFEYSSYNYRTFDIANHLNEWCFDYQHDDYPYFKSSLDLFPSIEKQKQFLGDYVDGLNYQITNTNKVAKTLNGVTSLSKEKMVDKLFDEMQPCLMASNLLWAMWAIDSALNSKIRFGYWEMVQSKWDCYLLTKKQFLQNSSSQLGCSKEQGDTRIIQSKI